MKKEWNLIVFLAVLSMVLGFIWQVYSFVQWIIMLTILNVALSGRIRFR